MVECRVGLGDCRDLISKDLGPNSVHAVVTDPPYGIRFLGLDWDKVLPDPECWKRCYEVMRPGAFLLAFGDTRIYHRLGCQLEDVGFGIKDCLCWCYATGYPRGVNLGQADDRWQGWNTQLKNSWEAIIMAQKPLEGKYVDNVLKYNVGGLNIDECRMPYKDEADKKSLASFEHFAGKDYGDDRYFSANTGGKKQCNVHPDGRHPANLIWCDPMFVQYDHIFMVPKPSKREKGKDNEHNTVKPIELLERLIKLVTPRPSVVGEEVVVLDAFMGSGSTGIACQNLGRSFYGYELDKDSFKVAKKRLKERSRSMQDIYKS